MTIDKFPWGSSYAVGNMVMAGWGGWLADWDIWGRYVYGRGSHIHTMKVISKRAFWAIKPTALNAVTKDWCSSQRKSCTVLIVLCFSEKITYRRRLRRLGTGCMIRPQSSMSRHIPQFCGVLGHTFMEFLKGSGDYCQAQHDLYADKWTVEIHYYSTKKPP